MESHDDQHLKAINASVGRLVWVRRRNGSWWPGQTLVHDEVPEDSLVSPKVGTPIKLLGRDDVSVDWYILEKSKMVKAFRCGEYDACIEKAKAAAAAAASKKKANKCTRREDAINSALEIENAHLAKQDHPDDNLCSSSAEEDSKRCVSSKDDEDSSSADAGEETEDGLDSAPEQLQSSMSSQDMNNVGAPKVQPKRRRTPNDSEDDGTEGIKRMRGLEDIGKEQVVGILEHRQEMGLMCDVNLSHSMSNGKILANGNKVCSPLSLKKRRSKVRIANECSKRKNRRRQLTKVLESTAMVSVPVTCDQLVTSDCQGLYDSKVSGIESVESLKSVSVVINNNSDSTGISCENASENVVGASHNNKTKDSEISSISVSAEDDSSDRLFDVPLIGEDKDSAAGIPLSKIALVYGLTRRRGRSSHDVFVKKEGIEGSACTNLPATQPVKCNLNGIEKSTSDWQLKGKRNLRQMSKQQGARRNVYGEEANKNSSLPHSRLYEVKIEVKANYNKPLNVPLVSRMSGLNGKAIVGHPLTVEILEEGFCNGMGMSPVIVKAKSTSKKNGKKRKSHGALRKSLKSKKKSSSQSKKTRRLSTLTSQRLTDRSKKQTTEKPKETVVACIPLKVVFSRINEVLKGSARQTQHRALP